MKKFRDITLQAPKYLCIMEALFYQETLAFLDDLTDKVENNYTVTINFRRCLFISAPTALLLFSTISHIQITYGFLRVNIQTMTKGNELIYDPVITQSGVWEAINCQSMDDVEKLIERDNRFKTSCHPRTIKNIEQLLAKIADINQEHVFFLTMAIKEAITNIVYHAYDPDNNYTDRWWQCAWVDTHNKIVNIIIHDRGVGILGRYKKQGYGDEQALKEAMLQGFSSSGLSNRGMGSEDMKRPVNELSGFQLFTVYTGKYIYNYQLSCIEPQITRRESSICGTLIHWQCGYGG